VHLQAGSTVADEGHARGAGVPVGACVASPLATAPRHSAGTYAHVCSRMLTHACVASPLATAPRHSAGEP
jgi:hypothetical protein